MTFFYLITGRHSHIIPGVIIGCREEILAAMTNANAIEGDTEDGIRDGIDCAIKRLIEDGSLVASIDAPLMYLPNALRHNRPTSPGQLIAWAKAWDDIPECSLKEQILKGIYGTLDGMSDGMRDAFVGAMPDGTSDTEAVAVTEDNSKMKLKRVARKRRVKAELDLARAMSLPIMQHLSEKTGKTWEPKKYSLDLICDLIHEQKTLADIVLVISYCSDTWSGDYRKHLKPKTLLNLENFGARLDEAKAFYSRTSKNELPELKGI